ncbi:MAG: polysaccharide pyruvyl transferase family protein [Clostridia bacterium]|nr:polysaccharide pyruvyl transferase family protein [Clostridia bacterium]MBR4910002.1 polysaccharide pyruvyl transferase family protein [Clostridia bacterium]
MKSKPGRVAILTRTSTNNFGTILQAYALQNYISSLGFEVYVIDDSIPRKEYVNVSTLEKPNQSVKARIYNCFDHLIEKIQLIYYLKFKQNTANFKKKHIRYYKPKSTQELNSKFDIFVSGSDQIWANAAEPLLFPFFMQDFVSDEKAQISYAVSIGESVFPESKKELVNKLVNRFDYLSVRELPSKQMLRQYTDKSISVTCDPVLLLKNEIWDIIAGKRKVKEKYIFCYFLSENSWYCKKVQELTEFYGFQAYIVGKKHNNFTATKFKYIENCSPEDFLNYIKYSSFVLTDSFHATLFSIIFGSSFNVFERFKDKTNTQNNRLLYILDRFSIKSLYIKNSEPLNFEKVDYSAIKDYINSFAEESKQYLYSALCSYDL